MTTATAPVPADPYVAVRAAVAVLGASIEAATCRICGKFETHPHDNATRAAHVGHLARHGWSGMCPAPRPVADFTQGWGYTQERADYCD